MNLVAAGSDLSLLLIFLTVFFPEYESADAEEGGSGDAGYPGNELEGS